MHVLVDGLATEFHRTGGPLNRQRRSARLDCVQNLPRTFRIRKIGTATQPTWLSPYIPDAVRHPADSLAVIDDPSNVRIFKITNIKSTVRNHEMILPIVIGGCVPARRKTEQEISCRTKFSIMYTLRKSAWSGVVGAQLRANSGLLLFIISNDQGLTKTEFFAEVFECVVVKMRRNIFQSVYHLLGPLVVGITFQYFFQIIV